MSVYFKENRAEEGHSRKSLHNGVISIGARGIIALVQVGSVMFLARLLSPEDYGLVSMVTAIAGLAPLLIDLGTRDAVGQRHSITEGEISALFWITVAMGCGFALLVAASGPVIARLYGEPRLTPIALLYSVTIVASALSYQHHALLRRAMMFSKLVTIEIGATVLGAGCAILIAFQGGAYWALVARPIATSAFTAIGVWSYCHWVPAKPTITAGVKEMLNFGIHTIGFCWTDFLGKNCDRVAIGLVQGPRILGYFQNSLLIYDNLLDLSWPLQGVALVSLCKLRHNLDELRRSWGNALSILAFYAMPMFGIIAVISQDLIPLLLGEKWLIAGALLSVLSLRGIAHVVERTAGWLHAAAGRGDRLLRWGIAATIVQLVALFSGLPFGSMGVIVAYVLAAFVSFAPAVAYAGRPLGIGVANVINVVGRQMVGALCSAAVGFLLQHTLFADLQRAPRMAALVLAYIGVYFVLVVLLFKVTTPLRVTTSLVRDFFPSRLAPFVRLAFRGPGNGQAHIPGLRR